MAKFFRQADLSSDDSEGSIHLSESDSSDRPAPIQPHLDRDRNRTSSASSSSAASESDLLIDHPTLPVHPNLILAVKGEQRDPSASPPDQLPATVVQDILQRVPTKDFDDNDELTAIFTRKVFKCDNLDIWLQAVDPDTGDSLVHAIVRSGRIEALGACLLPRPKCRNGLYSSWGLREKYILLTHQNNKGDTGLHVAARMGPLPMVRGLLRLLKGRDVDDGVEIPGEFDRLDEARVLENFLWDAESVLFLEAKNKIGSSAIEEARHAGQKEVAEFLEYVLDQSYPPGCADREDARKLARLRVNQSYRFRSSQKEV